MNPAAAELLKRIEWHPAEELYDTHEDPYELNNLVGQPEHAGANVQLHLPASNRRDLPGKVYPEPGEAGDGNGGRGDDHAGFQHLRLARL